MDVIRHDHEEPDPNKKIARPFGESREFPVNRRICQRAFAVLRTQREIVDWAARIEPVQSPQAGFEFHIGSISAQEMLHGSPIDKGL
jgi:hypothetical protein